MRTGRLAAAVALAIGTGCPSQPTELLLEISSPLGIPEDVDRLDVEALGETTGTRGTASFDLTSSWPHWVAITPAGDETETVAITVTARKRGPGDPEGVRVVQRALREAFERGRRRTIPVELGAAADGGLDAGPDRDADVDAGPECSIDVDCDDGDTCNGSERCDGMRCVAGVPMDCGDAIACTRDGCAGGVCTHTPDDTLCAPGDRCGPASGCEGRPCTTNTDCDDGRPCNGSEQCTGGICRTSPLPDCDDADACTDDRCADPTGCIHSTRDADRDGHGDRTCPEIGGVPADDCDDAAPGTFPGAPDTCNARDDDCDGSCDEPAECCRGGTGTCTTACGTAGMRVCGLACGWDPCAPPAETCNGADDDCDGVCDDGLGCCQGMTTPCTTTCGSAGTASCDGSCRPGPCIAPAEACNGADDDCDTIVDETFACVAGSTMACMTSCGSTGSITCAADCTAGACAPPLEACGNTADEDCDTRIDEGCMGGCGVTCAGATTIAGVGGRYAVSTATTFHSGSCGGGGAESSLSFVIAEPSDVFIATHGTAADTVIYLRSCNCTGPEMGCNDDADGRTSSRLELTSLPAGSYTVFVDTETAMSTTLDVHIYVTPADAAGDKCGRPLRLPVPTVAGNTCAFDSDGDSSCVSSAGQDVYYWFLVDGAMRTVTLDTCSGCTTYDSVVKLRRVCVPQSGGWGLDTGGIACDDDGCRSTCAPPGGRPQSTVTRDLAPGIYFVVVDGNAACGDYVLTATGL